MIAPSPASIPTYPRRQIVQVLVSHRSPHGSPELERSRCHPTSTAAGGPSEWRASLWLHAMTESSSRSRFGADAPAVASEAEICADGLEQIRFVATGWSCRREPSSRGVVTRRPPATRAGADAELAGPHVPRNAPGGSSNMDLSSRMCSWTWEEFVHLPRLVVESDLNCATCWSRFDNPWGESRCRSSSAA